jgi:hypothetical protein
LADAKEGGPCRHLRDTEHTLKANAVHLGYLNESYRRIGGGGRASLEIIGP